MNKTEKLARLITKYIGGCFVPLNHCWEKRIPYSKKAFFPNNPKLNREQTDHCNAEHERQRQLMLSRASKILKEFEKEMKP